MCPFSSRVKWFDCWKPWDSSKCDRPVLTNSFAIRMGAAQRFHTIRAATSRQFCCARLPGTSGLRFKNWYGIVKWSQTHRAPKEANMHRLGVTITNEAEGKAAKTISRIFADESPVL